MNPDNESHNRRSSSDQQPPHPPGAGDPRSFSDQPQRRLPLGASLALAGVGILVLLIALWLFQRARSQNRDYTALVNQYVQPYPKLPVFADSVVLPNAMVEGLRAFEGRQFGTAIDQLLRIPSSSPHHRLSQYYLGVALLAEGRYQAANEALEQASEVNAWQAREPAQFFLALSLMGQGLPEAACTWINPVGYHANTRYSKSARELYGRFCP